MDGELPPEHHQVDLTFERPGPDGPDTVRTQFRVGAGVRRGLLALAGEDGNRLETVVLAGLVALLSRLGLEARALAGIRAAPGNGTSARRRVMRTDPAGDPSPRQLAARLGEAAPATPAPGRPDLVLRYAAEGTGPADGLRGVLEIRADLLDRAARISIAEHLERVLSAVAENPDRPVSGIDLLAAAERERLTVTWNDTDTTVPPRSLPELFQDQVARRPDAIALVAGETELTYRELNTRANRLARFLVERGACPERYVAVALSRTEDLVVALLAVLKSGAAYVPVDPGYPADRIGHILADAAPALLLTDVRTAPALPAAGTSPVVLDAPRTAAELARYPADDLLRTDLGGGTSVLNPAYAIYTSGSTGRPKGVVVTTEALVNFLHAMAVRFRPGPGDRLLAVTTVAFDIAALELYLPLISGACVDLAPRELVRDPVALGARIASTATTIVQATPSLWRVLVTEAGGRLAGVHALVGGEALPGELARALVDRAASVTNLYGPTETTIWSTAAAVDGPVATAPTIGGPIANTRVYVLDGALQPVPVGVPGELYIAGDGLARGYLGRPDLTAERFVADPFSLSGRRMYRTGDIVRWNSGAVLEYLGRVDQQVKVRGFRIELGEIEAVLDRHPHITQSAVLVREDHPGDPRLVAYLVPAVGPAATSWTVAGLREHCSRFLPDYMVPASYTALDALPLTPNGKLDRKALPIAGNRTRAPGRAPASPAEVVLCGLFSEVLGVPEVWADDDFLHLGGHSLAGIRLIGRIATTLGVEVGLETLFESGTVAELAKALDGAGAARPALRRRPRSTTPG